MRRKVLIFSIIAVFFAVLSFKTFGFFSNSVSYQKSEEVVNTAPIEKKITAPVIPPLDTLAYDKKINELANNPPD